MTSAASLDAHVLANQRHQLRNMQATGRRAMAQLSLEQMLAAPGPGMNSVAVLVQHMAGNMRSRFTDFLTSDGEKPWRHRDSEFETPAFASADEVLARWDAGWSVLHTTLEALQPADLLREVTVRGQVHTVYQAILRQLQHYAYHLGQIVQLARWQAGENWQWLTVAPGESANYRPTGNLGEPPLAP